MKLPNRFLHMFLVSALPLALPLSVALAAHGQAKPSLFSQAESVTDENPNEVVEAKVWLRFHDKQVLDDTVSKLYEQGSPTYHHWLKASDLLRFSPTASDVETVKKELSTQGLTVTSVGPRNGFLKVTGTVAAMQAAFQTGIKSLVVKGQAIRATTTEPKLAGTAGSMVSAVTGLTQTKATLDLIRAVDPATGKPYAVSAAASPNGIFFDSGCFRGVEAETFKTPGASLPIGQYVGNRYGANITNSTLGFLPPCGYDAANVTTAYGMTAAYAKGLNGTGQTIVIVDAYAQPTIKADANLFSKLNRLPALTSSNFEIIYPGDKPTIQDPTSTVETSLDVEWAHALAPGAKIVLVIAPSLYFSDLETSVFYAIANQLGGVISNSYGAPEALVDKPDIIIENSLSELGAALGISVNYASGDYGDDEAAYGVKTVSMPSDSPYSTSVGGTTLAINSSNKMEFQTGWGNNLTQVATGANGVATGPLDPPANDGFYAGSGGGESQVFAKPSWQSKIPGSGRQQPDVSLIADPFTGVEVVLTLDGEQEVGVVGGTSLACPTFSAIWAIANQRAGQIHGRGALLGQAAPIVAKLSGSTALTDVKVYSSPTNVAGFIFGSHGATFYSPNQLTAPLENTTKYLSDLYNDATGAWYTLSFGTDSSLVVGPGWDNVTGFGTPNGLTFIDDAAK